MLGGPPPAPAIGATAGCSDNGLRNCRMLLCDAARPRGKTGMVADARSEQKCKHLRLRAGVTDGLR